MSFRRTLLVFALLPLFSLRAQDFPLVYAHRGCWFGTEVPENSVAAVEMAARFGYPAIECDVHYTADSVMVIMHDYKDMRKKIRKRDGNQKIDSLMGTSDISFADLRQNYVLNSSKPENREPVPTLEELLEACRESHVMPVLHSSIVESYDVAQRMFGDEWVAFSGNDSVLKEARRRSDCLILMGQTKGTAETAVRRMKEIGGRVAVSSMNYDMMTKEFCDTILSAGFGIQSSIFPVPHEAESMLNGATILLSNWSYLPNPQKKPARKLKIGKHFMRIGQTFHVGEEKETEYGACVLELTFKGTVQVTLNGQRTYKFHRSSLGTDYVGMRFLREKPEVEVLSMEYTDIKKGRLWIYKF